MAHFFCNNQEDNKKYHLANWQLVAQKKEFGGLGVPDLQLLNLCPLASWIARYHKSSDSMWRRIVDDKYKTIEPNMF